MIQVLCVDDDIKIQESLVPRLRAEIPGIRVESAWALGDALEMAWAARQRKDPYDLVILDFMLPIERDGRNTGVHKGLRRELLESLGGIAIVYHITRFRRDPEVQEFLVEENLDSTDLPRPVVFDETEIDWKDRLMAQIRRDVHGARIEREFERIFPTDRGSRPRSAMRPTLAAAASLRDDAYDAVDLTQGLNLLIRDIEMHWRDLSEDLQGKIRQVFDVQELASGEVALLS